MSERGMPYPIGFVRSMLGVLGVAVGTALTSCAGQSSSQLADDATQRILKTSFREQGIAKLDRLEQDDLQKTCSTGLPPASELAQRIEATQLATIEWPSDGNYVGDWREGEKLAQNGRGMTWVDRANEPAGGSCYNCHRITKDEISFGTLGPSLYQYGRLRGIADPAAASSAEVVRHTWGKIWNAKAYNACSGMPRFGHAGVLTQAQVRDLVALLLDPNSPVNAP